MPPLVWHDPFEQVPLVPAPVQVDPLPIHLPATQHPPPWQLFAAQQALPAVPQLVAPVPPVVVDEPPHDVATVIATVSTSTIGRKDRLVTIHPRIIVITPIVAFDGPGVPHSSLSAHWCPPAATLIVFVFPDGPSDARSITTQGPREDRWALTVGHPSTVPTRSTPVGRRIIDCGSRDRLRDRSGHCSRKNDAPRRRHCSVLGMAAVAVTGCLRACHIAFTPHIDNLRAERRGHGAGIVEIAS